MDGANLSGASLVETDLNGGVLSLSDFSGANLRGASLAGCWVNLASMVGADLSYANLSSSTFLGTDLTGANLQYAHLNGANLVGANLSGSNLSGADLTGAILILPPPENAQAGFSYDTLTGQSLLLALSRSSMAKVIADSRVAELTEVRLKPLLIDTVLQGVTYDKNTLWPVGFEIPPSAIFVDQ